MRQANIMLDNVRALLHKHHNDGPLIAATVLVHTETIKAREILQSIPSEQLVDLFFDERSLGDARQTLQYFAREVEKDYTQRPDIYRDAGLTPEKFADYLHRMELRSAERQRDLCHQFEECLESEVEKNLSSICESGAEALVGTIDEENICNLLKDDFFREFITRKETTGAGAVLAASSCDDLKELLDRTPVSEIGEVLQKSLDLDMTRSNMLSRYLHQIFANILIYTSRYRINGLFIAEDAKKGYVRDVYVGISPYSEDRLHFGPIADEAFRRSAELGRKAAIELANKMKPGGDDPSSYGITLHIESAAEKYEGSSIGLAVALAILARFTKQAIGVQQVGDVAVTGGIVDDTGSIGRVEGIAWKTKAIIDRNSQKTKAVPIRHLFVPKENEREAHMANDRYGGKLEIHAFYDLKSLVAEGALFDPFRQYLEHVIRETKPESAISDEDWARISCGSNKQVVILGRFDEDKRCIADNLAMQFAENKLYPELDPEIPVSSLPIPICLDARILGSDDKFPEAILQQLEQAAPGYFDEALIHRFLRAGQFSIIIDGLDGTDKDMPIFAPGAAMHEYRRFYSASQVIFVCNESSWGRYSKKIMGAECYDVIPRYTGRSTFLDNHIVGITERGAQRAILACGDFAPKGFFYGSVAEGPLYIELQVQKFDRDGNPMGSPELLSEVIAAGEDRHILLVADGGAGKTTLLLKLFFDCLEGICKPQLGEAKTDCLWDQAIVPLFVKIGGLGSAEYESLYRILPGTQLELGATKNVLIIMDGLNEVTRSIRRDSADLANCIHQFLRDLDGRLPKKHWVVLSCRKQEEIREKGSLIDQVAYDELEEHFAKYEILDLSNDAGQNYLLQVVPESAEELIEMLGENQRNLLANPMLLYLFSTLRPNRIAEIKGRQKRGLNRSLIYQMAMDEWIERQFKGGQFAIFREYSDAPRELLRILAREMVDKGISVISEMDAVNIFEEIQEIGPPKWWPMRDGPVGAKEVVTELIAGGVLKVSDQ